MIRNILDAQDIVSSTFYLDTKNHSSESEKLAAAQLAKLKITKFKPDVVITSDDDAVKYVLMPYFKDSAIPFVFCGVNWDATDYGLPYGNTTGMLEVELISEMVKNLQEYTKGRRLGTLALDGFTERKWVAHYREHLDRPIDRSYFPSSFEEWKDNFLRLQHEVDMVILLNPKGLKDFDMQEAQSFVEKNIKVPTGSSIVWMSHMSLLGITLVPEEQGLWAAQTAINILDGAAPNSIPITHNRQGKLFINLKIAEKLGITFKPYLLKVGDIIR
ncbi:MAG: ABC transporter substrate binding protein [Thiotrichaceae bacterium]|nr:ABC transporter substrate binding protein [Thiotrichaceae bacterium]